MSRFLCSLTLALSPGKKGRRSAAPPWRWRRQRGATLVEMVLVILILGIASIAIMDQFVNMARSYTVNERLQTGAQLAQGCAEQILATRRLQGYAAAIASSCPALPPSYASAGYTRSVSFNPTACVTLPCTVDVVVNHSATNPTELARVVFMLGSY